MQHNSTCPVTTVLTKFYRRQQAHRCNVGATGAWKYLGTANFSPAAIRGFLLYYATRVGLGKGVLVGEPPAAVHRASGQSKWPQYITPAPLSSASFTCPGPQGIPDPHLDEMFARNSARNAEHRTSQEADEQENTLAQPQYKGSRETWLRCRAGQCSLGRSRPWRLTSLNKLRCAGKQIEN